MIICFLLSLVGIGATFTTVIACILFFTQIVIDERNNVVVVEHEVHGFRDFFLAFGTLLFAFGGASTFPTIQNDMVNKKQFSGCVLIAFAGIQCGSTLYAVFFVTVTFSFF